MMLCARPSYAQNTGATDSELREDVGKLQNQLAETQSKLTEAEAQIQQLRAEMQQIKSQLGSAPTPKTTDQSGAYPTLQNALNDAKPESASNEDLQMLASRVDEQAQVKVESASRYKVRLSGLILMNTYANVGHVDITDLPNLAFSAPVGAAGGGDFGATLRQTQLGLEVIGPEFASATTGGDVQADFFGGFPDVSFGVTSGLFRLRIARGYLNWKRTRIIVGQDEPFFSPLSPTSYATVAEPAFAWAGNLWVWTPQIRVEHDWKVSDTSKLTMQFGMLDALTEADPSDQFKRRPTPGEASRIPAVAWHGFWSGKLLGKDAMVGVGTYFSRQSFTFGRHVNGWGVMADYNLPLTSKLSWSGEVFRGRALGGLGGGVWNSVVYSGPPASPGTQVLGLNDIGGWSQLKFQPLSRLEFNVAAGTDNPFASDIEFFPYPTGTYFPPLVRNQSIFTNSIYRPRSNLLLALEYRHLRTYFISPGKQTSDQVNLALGVSF